MHMMECRIEQAALLKLLEPLTKVTSHRLAGLQSVLLTMMDGHLQARGTNLEIEVIRTAPAETQVAGTALVHCGRLVSLVKSFAAGPVTLTVDATMLRVQSGQAVCQLPLAAAENYQALPQRVAQWIEAVPTRLVDHCARVAYAGKKANEEYGVCLLTIDGVATVGCASHGRVALIRDATMPTLPDLLIPATLQALFIEGATSGEETARVGIGDTLVYEAKDAMVVMPCAATKPPPLGDLLARINLPAASVAIPREMLLDIVKRAELVYEPQGGGRLELATVAGEPTLTTRIASSLGALTDTVGIEVPAATVTVGVSPVFLREALIAMKQFPVVRLHLGAATQDPLFITPLESMDEIHIIAQVWKGE